MQTGDDKEVYGFGFLRSPKGNSEAELFLSTSLQPAPGSRVEAIFDGASGNRYTLDLARAENRQGVWYFPGQNPENALLNAMMAGNTMVLKLEVEDGNRKLVHISLSGVTGSALFMDEAQGRLGNRDALQAKGDGEPQDAKTRAAVLNSSGDLPAEVLRFWREASGNCAEGSDENQDLIADFGGLSISVEYGARLYVLPCGLPGAYNLPQTVLAFDGETKEVRTVSLPIMGQRGPTLVDYAYNTNWDDRKSTLTAFYKGRGLGDCGSRSVWYWEGGYYSNFELVEEYIKDNCDGIYDDWPQIWPPQ